MTNIDIFMVGLLELSLCDLSRMHPLKNKYHILVNELISSDAAKIPPKTLLGLDV